MTVYLDFETNSPLDLELVGARTYAEHKATRVTCLAYAIGDGPVQVWWPGDGLPADPAAALAAGCRVVAHNFQFDLTVWHQHMVPLGWPAIPLARWSCTAFRARLARLPASLEHLAIALDLPVGKDMAGRRFMLAIARRDLDAHPLTGDERDRLGAYAARDVDVLRAADRSLPEMPDEWRPLFELDHELNCRGMPVDLDAVRKLIVVRDAENARLAASVARLTGGEITSAKNQRGRLQKRLDALRADVPNLKRGTLERWVADHPQCCDLAAQLVSARLEAAHSADAKLDRMVAAAEGSGRVRDSFILHGAHTGRWAGRGVQLQNLPRSKLDDPEAMLQRLLDRADRIASGTLDPMVDPGWPVSIKQAITDCLKGTFKAPDGWTFVVADFEQIEPRVISWLAGAADKLSLYASGADIYTAQAKALGSDNRQFGKLVEMSSLYGASSRVMHTRAPGFDVVLSEAEAAEMTARWRENNPAIVAFWHDLAAAIGFVVEMPVDQPPVAFNRFRLWRDTEMVTLQLPSGRCLKYRNPELAPNPYGSLALSVDLPKHKQLLSVSFWHGIAVENVTSAIAYDLMTAAMLRLHADGIFLVSTVHDEITALAPVEHADAVRDHMLDAMLTLPDWADGLPLAADAYVNTRYLKRAKPAHAKLAPSAADRWMHCPGSIAAIAALPPEPPSVFAEEGSKAHAIFAACLSRDLDPVDLTDDPMTVEPLRYALLVARDVIGGRRFKVEVRLDPIPGLPSCWGTADVIVLDEHDRIVAIIDLKFGAIVAVEPDSLQLQIYGLLGAQQFGCPPEGVALHVVQPRRQHPNGPHRVHRASTDDLQRLYGRLQDAIQAVERADAPRIACEGCRYCPARQTCPEGRSAALPQRALVNPFSVGGANDAPAL